MEQPVKKVATITLSVLGDLLGNNLGLGFLATTGVFSGIIAIVLVLHHATRLNKVLLFWIAFVFTRL